MLNTFIIFLFAKHMSKVMIPSVTQIVLCIFLLGRYNILRGMQHSYVNM